MGYFPFYFAVFKKTVAFLKYENKHHIHFGDFW